MMGLFNTIKSYFRDKSDPFEKLEIIERKVLLGYTYTQGFEGKKVTVPEREILIFGYKD